MEKIKIGISIDHTFRNIYGKIKDIYQKVHIEDLVGEVSEEELPKIKLPINTPDIMNHIPFENEEEMMDFIFQEYPLEIFGYSKEVEKGSMITFNEWAKENKELFDIFLISNEVDRTKSSTLFFLAKLGFQGEKIIFIDDNVDIWEYCDILVTCNEIKNKIPDGKQLFIVDRLFNRDIKIGKRVSSLYEFFEINLEPYLVNNDNKN